MSKTSAKMTYVSERIEVDSQTGEERIINETKVVRLPREPIFVKMYIEDIGALHNLPKKSHSLIYELVKRMDYDGLIVLNSSIKRMIAEKLGTVKQTLDNSIQKLLKSKIIMRIDIGIYQMNPHLFAKGDWSDIRKLRDKKEFQLLIHYDESGNRIIEGKSTEDDAR